MNEAPTKPVILVHSDEYSNWVFNENHPTQGRRFTHARDAFIDATLKEGIEVREVAPKLASRTDLELVHSADYVSEVLDEHLSNEWSGPRADLSSLAATFAGGTLVALESLLNEEAQVAIHFPGAKHHAQYDHSSGFCVFADFALAAQIASERYGKKVAILDIDAHHGDGTENLTQENASILSFSIHEYGIFPGTGLESKPEQFLFNYPLGTSEGSGESFKDDSALQRGVEKFILVASEFQPDLIFIACGADGHEEDSLSTLRYSINGFKNVASRLKESFPNTPFLIGGAGGYLPDTRTPEVWSTFATAISRK